MLTSDVRRAVRPSAVINRSSTLTGLTFIGTLGMVAALAWFGQRPLPGDLALSRLLQGLLASDSLVGHAVARADWLVWTAAVLASVILTLRRRVAAACWLSLAVATGYMLGDVVLKPLLARPRPAAELVHISQPADSYSFPSTTTLVAVVLGGLLLYLVAQPARPAAAPVRRPPARVPATIGVIGLIVLTSVSRIYAGEHWASDVLGSWLVGSCWTLCLISLHAWWTRRWGARHRRSV